MNDSVVYFDHIPAREQDLPSCGFEPTRWYPTGCTREAGHSGDHGYPNWSGRVHFERSYFSKGLKMETRDSHGGAPVSIKSREQGEALIAVLRDHIDSLWPKEVDRTSKEMDCTCRGGPHGGYTCDNCL